MNQLSIIFIITLLMIFSIVTAVIFIIKHNRNTKGKYQLYWTTQKNLFSIKVNKGQFLVKADNLELAKKVGVSLATLKREITILRKNCYIGRDGSNKNGQWILLKV
mgnify:CR=1 FL=1